MDEGELQAIEVQPKFYLCSFPKAGLHLLELLVMPILQSMPYLKIFGKQGAWAGTFLYNSWSTEWAGLERTLFKVSTIWPGRYLKGHLGWHPRIVSLLRESGACMVFMYRDLRDVAVSQAYHVIDEDDDKFRHPGKDDYRALGSFEEIIKAVIRGLGVYSGLIERWELFAPWLDEDWVLPYKFEDMLADPKEAGADILLYAARRTSEILKGQIGLDRSDVYQYAEMMAAGSRETEKSPTFRKGIAGGWVEYWTPGVDKAFRESGGEEWLERLGYAGTPILPLQGGFPTNVGKHHFPEMGRPA